MISKLLNFINSFLGSKKEVYLIQSYEDIDFVEQILSAEKFLGLDTEFDWRNTYFPILSLLQISTENKIFLIDCLKIKNLSFLKNILEDKKKKLILHSSRSDTTVLHTNLNIQIENVYDIQIAENVISGGDIKNYGTIVKKYTSKKLEKSQTNSNWLKRPFSNDQLAYAAEDVDFLIEIYKKQVIKLNKIDKLNKVIKMSKIEANKGNNDLYITRIKKLRKASKLEKDIFMWREKYASKRNIPPSQVLKDKNFRLVLKSFQSNKFNSKLIRSYFKDQLAAKDLIENFKL